jgi:O-antigen ligase
MRAAIRSSLAVLLLAVPTVIAFFSGGYFAGPRLIAGVFVWLLALAAFWVSEQPLPREWEGRVALLGLVSLTALVGLSITWAPLRSVAQADLQRLLLYLGAFIAAVALLRGRRGLRFTELVLAAGALLVSSYALAARVLPGIVNEAASDSAAGRLEQPLTYWNASGVLAAVGLILAMRIAADVSRPAPLRSASVAAVVPLGLTAYLTFSRGALLAIAVGVIMLIVLSRERRQMRVFVVGICGAVLVSLAAAFLPAARTLQGTLNEREQQGLLLLIVLVAVSVAVVLVSHWWCAREDSGPLSAPRALAGALIVVVVIGFSAAAAGNGSSNGQPRYGADTRRLASFESNRYSYWKVAGGMFVAAPLAGDGSGSFRVVWRQERTILDPALDAHSLYLETGAELGILGLIALALFIGGVAWAGRNVALARRNEVTGALAALAALAVHAGLDWDWEMPAIALVGLLLAGVVVAANDEIGEAASADA